MEELFYKEDQLVALLEERPGERVVFIGINTNEEGNLLIYRHIFLNSMKFIDSYIFRGGVLSLVERLPINIQLSHNLYRNRYKTIIDN